MEEIQSYTDKLRKTYRQSVDVILPFTTHETVVHCNDDEFESYLQGSHSMKDLQACIYLLERHIDLQQEIIKGLTHLQEIHKYDKQSVDYNNISEKLITAQDKLALLRSRTVRCLTKQIQQRCGDSNTVLPPCSSKCDNKTTIPTECNALFTNSDQDNSESSQKFDQHKTFPEQTALNSNLSEDQNKTLYGKTDPGISLMSRPSEDDRACQIDGSPVAIPQNSENITMQEDVVPDQYFTNLHDDNMQPLKNIVNSEKSSMDQNQNHSLHDVADNVSHEQLATSNGLDIFHESNVPDTSGYSSGHYEEKSEQSMNYDRQILEPIEETVVVELIETNQDDSKGLPKKENASEKYISSEEEMEQDDSIDINDTVVESYVKEIDPLIDYGRLAPDEVVPSSNINTLSWDPGMLLREIYGKVKPIESHSQQLADEMVTHEEIHMAGYLEKLPINKKRASLLKSWRKRYFKMLNGKLLYFQDHRTTTPIGFIKLAGSKVVEIGNKCLEVTEMGDLGDKLLVIRCASWTELSDWRKALESETTQKVKRQHFELQPERKVIIVDFGSSSIKAGFVEDDAWPQVIIPSVYAVHKENSDNIWYGYEALEPPVRNNCKLVFPLRAIATVGKFLLDPNQLIGFLEMIFKELQVDPSHHQVIMTTPAILRDQDKERLVEILLDYFQVAGVYMKSQAILSMYSYSATCGIVVNIGDNIDIVPIEDGYIVESGVTTLPYGGRQVTDHFIRLLSSSGHRYFSKIENYIGEYLKIKTCYISQNFEKELKDDSHDVSVKVDMSPFNLPNGDELVTVGKERFRAYEVIFNPELWGKDNPGITELVYQAVMACSIDSRKDMCRNIYLSGATTKVPGFAERLQNELSGKFPSSVIVQVHAAADRQFAAFIGAAVLASLENFDDLCITGEEWEQVGPDALKKWDGI